jgi:hypothetical protein
MLPCISATLICMIGKSVTEPLRQKFFLRVLMLVPLMGLLFLCVALAKKKTTPPPTGLPVQVFTLAKQLGGVALEDAGPITSQIQKLVIDHMTEWMANRTPTDVEARRELESVFSLLHYPLDGLPATFQQSWNGQVILGVGYTLSWSAYDRQNVLAIYSTSSGKTQFVTVTNFVPHTDLHYVNLPQYAWQDMRFFVWGTRVGKSQDRISVILYSFDGKNLKSLWQSQDIYDGRMDVLGDKVVIRYLKEEEYVHAVERGGEPSRHQATYQLTAAGMQLLDDHDIPF